LGSVTFPSTDQTALRMICTHARCRRCSGVVAMCLLDSCLVRRLDALPNSGPTQLAELQAALEDARRGEEAATEQVCWLVHAKGCVPVSGAMRSIAAERRQALALQSSDGKRVRAEAAPI
jgi:hypothetical protein